MLYDPKWEVKADPLSIESLIAWLEQQPPSQEYAYYCGGTCLLAQYFTAMGFQNVHMFADGFWSGDTPCPGNVGWNETSCRKEGTPLPRGFNAIACRGEGRTFGAALQRAREIAR